MRDTTLVTGASGYVGGRLVAALERRGTRVRCLARRPELLAGRFAASTEVMAGDLLEPGSLPGPLAGVTTAYYLVHSLGSRGAHGRWEREEERAAEAFAGAARAAGVARIVYLGGLANSDRSEDSGGSAHMRSRQREGGADSAHMRNRQRAGGAGSAHMRSRLRVGAVLRGSGIPTVELRASVIIGAGSLSFEMIRALVQRLPVMVMPRWVSVPAQPIAIADVLDYLVAAGEMDLTGSRVFEIGGAAVTTYRGLMEEYARQCGLRRLLVPVPLLTPHLSSLWLGLVTPLFARVGRKLIESITIPSVVSDPAAAEAFGLRPRDYRDAIRQALADEDARFVATRWADAASALTVERRRWGGVHFGTRLVDSRAVTVAVPAPRAFGPIQRIGGRTGWYYGDWLWRLRGAVDRLLGGPGMKRGRRDGVELRPGDVLDCWRVVAYEPPHRLTLEAEMRLPGRAWLQFEVAPRGDGAEIRQTALYDPVGITGRAYWYLLYPAHEAIFRGMLRRIARYAEGNRRS
ncbi:MAG: SDR family oxidoreductase [Spirochaetaceae bacterium]|nr:SDR family oxidoreductase [Spirochaetaceae bacterium]